MSVRLYLHIQIISSMDLGIIIIIEYTFPVEFLEFVYLFT